MASALGLRVAGYNLAGDPPQLQLQYEVFFRDETLNVAESMSVYFNVPADVTPQQFRTLFAAAILEAAGSTWPTMELTESDCLIDVVQRGN